MDYALCQQMCTRNRPNILQYINVFLHHIMRFLQKISLLKIGSEFPA